MFSIKPIFERELKEDNVSPKFKNIFSDENDNNDTYDGNDKENDKKLKHYSLKDIVMYNLSDKNK